MTLQEAEKAKNRFEVQLEAVIGKLKSAEDLLDKMGLTDGEAIDKFWDDYDAKHDELIKRRDETLETIKLLIEDAEEEIRGSRSKD